MKKKCDYAKAIDKGRTIYAGIEKFVCFIMSVHFAEVSQIFLCILARIPVMRQPLQILYLILVRPSGTRPDQPPNMFVFNFLLTRTFPRFS